MSQASLTETIQELTEQMLRKMGISFDKVTIKEQEENTFRINILSEDASLLIGHFGETLSALQYVIKAIMSDKKVSETPLFLICDVEGYKERQEEKVKAMAEKAVEAAKETKEEQPLPSMSPYFRKIVHMHIKHHEAEGIFTESQGEGDDRHIVVKWKEE